MKDKNRYQEVVSKLHRAHKQIGTLLQELALLEPGFDPDKDEMRRQLAEWEAEHFKHVQP